MQQNAFVQSMKTIAQSLINKAGFDKTRSGKVVGVNTLTNTYSVKLDGHVYSNVRTVNDSTYNVGDTVKVNVPMNNPSQMYITASIFSDSSIGNKIGHAQSLIDQANEAIEDITVILGRIYQLSIKVTYSNGQDGAVIATYQAVLTQDGQDVTSRFSASRFHWFLQDVTGVVEKGTGTSISLSSADYLYGQTILCEWWEVDSDVVLLRARATLFNNAAVEEVKTKVDEAWEIATNEAQYFWFSENESDNGAHISYYSKDDFMSNPRGGNLLANANGVAVRKGLQEILGLYADPNNSERNGLYFNGYIGSGSQAQWGLIAKYTGTGISFNENIPYTIGNGTSYIKYLYEGGKYKIKIAADQITLGGVEVAKKTDIVNDVPYLTEITSGGVFVHRADANHDSIDPTNAKAYGVKIADTVDIISAGKALASYGSNVTFRNTSGYTTAVLSGNSFNFYCGTQNNNYAIASFSNGGITLKNTNGITTFVAQANGITLYNGNSTTNVALATFGTGSITLKNASNITTFSASNSGMYLYNGGSPTNVNVASFTTSGITLRNANNNIIFSAGSNALNLYYYNSDILTNVNVMSVSGSGLTIRDTSNNIMSSFQANNIYLGQNDSTGTIWLAGNNFYMKAGTDNPQDDSGLFYWIGCNSTGYTGTNQIKQTAISTIRKTQIGKGSYPSKYAQVGTYILNGGHHGFLEAWGSGSIGSQVSVGSDGYTYIAGNKGVTIETSSSGDFIVAMSGTNDYYEMIKVHNYSSGNSPKWRVYFPHSYNADFNDGRAVKLNSNGLLNTNSSSRRYKHDIVYDIKEELNPQKLYNLKIAQFKFNADHIEGYNKGRDLIGIIAEDIDEVYHIGAYHESDGTPEDWDERILIPAMLKLIQEQHEEIEKLKSHLNIE